MTISRKSIIFFGRVYGTNRQTQTRRNVDLPRRRFADSNILGERTSRRRARSRNLLPLPIPAPTDVHLTSEAGWQVVIRI